MTLGASAVASPVKTKETPLDGSCVRREFQAPLRIEGLQTASNVETRVSLSRKGRK